MLVAGRIYTDIMEKTGASSAIISRVSRMLAEENGELRPILEKERSAQET
jgi:uncharacterized protein YerC